MFFKQTFSSLSVCACSFSSSFFCGFCKNEGGRVELIEEKSEIPDANDAKIVNNVNGKVTLNNVYFSYVPDKKLIEDFNLEVKTGQRIAIVGPTGCGKTTLIKGILGLLAPKSGEIKFVGMEQKFVGYMPQETPRKHRLQRLSVA